MTNCFRVIQGEHGRTNDNQYIPGCGQRVRSSKRANNAPVGGEREDNHPKHGRFEMAVKIYCVSRWRRGAAAPLAAKVMVKTSITGLYLNR